MECTSLRERERVQKCKINEEKKKGLGEKCTHKKKETSRNEKIGQVRRSLEKKFGQSESERLLHREIWYLQVGFFFLSI